MHLTIFFIRTVSEEFAQLEEELHDASSEGDLNRIRQILDVPLIDVNVQFGPYQTTALMEACVNPDAVRLFLRDGRTDLDSRNLLGERVLGMAAREGLLGAVRVLLGSVGHVGVNARDSLSRTPLIAAAFQVGESLI